MGKRWGVLFRISKIQTFESNSQLPVIVRIVLFVVQNIKDTNFWKQFTTLVCSHNNFCKLFRISKIQTFESNSQLPNSIAYCAPSCSEYQRYKLLKAIHNYTLYIFHILLVVQNIKDTNFWKQFTTFIYSSLLMFSCSEYQRYKLLKAIHNCLSLAVVMIIVVQNIKDTNFWKQFTTRWPLNKSFESCSEYQRYKLLKAIHNSGGRCDKYHRVVQNIKDTNFWKQFTTRVCLWILFRVLFRISKIQTFESNSQLTD